MNTDVRNRFLAIMATGILLVALGSCSARRNTAPSRFYHSLNARYNIYFNGKTSFDEACKSMNDGYTENYTEQIHLFPVSGIYKGEKSSVGGPFNRAIDKSNKAIRLHSIKDKPPRKPGWQNDPAQVKRQAQEEFNPFMKHCWMLIGEGQFYNGDFLTSAVTFSYIARHFATDPALVAEARIWQARCYTEMDWFYETNNALKKLQESGIPPKSKKAYDRMYADYLIRNEQLREAIPYLQNAVKAEKNKRQRARMRYLLGQIYRSAGQEEEAYRTFGKVAASNPPYEIEFAARIRQTEVFPGGNSEKVLKMLRRMAKSDKNKDFLDQVYYAMGNVYMTRQDTAKAIECYAEGVEKSTQNGMDKAICQIRLGDIYFAQKDYLHAQPCFSGALAGIRQEYKDYERVSRLSETLDELVIHYEAVTLQDSLQTLARMTEEERLAVIDKIIEQVIEEEKKAKEEAEKEAYLADQAAMGSNLPAQKNLAMPVMPAGGGGGDNAFYFYNRQVVEQGKTQFQNKWGKRTLEDDWRRRNKKMTLLPAEEATASAASAASDALPEGEAFSADSLSDADTPASDVKSREYYLQQIPLTDDDMAASNEIVVDGLFNMGMIYKDMLEDMNLSLEAFEELDRRFPDNPHRMDYYYQIYLMALRYDEPSLAEKYKGRMLADFAGSDYAVAISDPAYVYNMQMMDRVQDSIYAATYEAFLAEDTATVRGNYREFGAKYPLAKLMPKFMFLNALTCVQAGDPEGFKRELLLLTEKYPSADVSELAGEMLKGLLRGRRLMQHHFAAMTWNIRFGTGEEGTLSAADSARTFSAEQAAPHRMLLIYTRGSLDRNALLYAVAAYNFANFRVKGFDLTSEEVGSLSILTITGFDHLQEILDYYRMIYAANGYASALDEAVTFFPISDGNYQTLMHGKTLEEYMSFFIENYGDAAPAGLIDRWRIRVDADRRASEEQSARQIESPPAEVAGPDPFPFPTEEEEFAPEPLPLPADTAVVEAPADLFGEEVEHAAAASEGEEKRPAAAASSEEEEKRPAAKKDNLFRRLFKRIRETDEFKKIKEGVDLAKELAEEEEQPADSVVKKPLERGTDGELTLEQLREMRRLEAEETAAGQAEKAIAEAEAKKAAEALKKQQAKEREQLRREKEKASKARLKQKERERKQKEKERKRRLREKEKARKSSKAAKSGK